jgi:hypothetical protein
MFLPVRTVAVCAAGLIIVSIAGPAQAGLVYAESGGVVAMEAEYFSNRAADAQGRRWQVVPYEGAGFPSFANPSNGSYLQLSETTGGTFTGPNFGGGPGVSGNRAYVDYDIAISTLGVYQLYLRVDGYDGNSDTLYASILQLADGSGGTTADWYRYNMGPGGGDANFATIPWRGNAGFERTDAGANNPMLDQAATWNITAAGTYTIRIFMREDGIALDKLVFQLSSLPAPTGLGPAAVPAPPAVVLLAVGGLGVIGARLRRRAA